MELLELMRKRRSVRKYTDEKIADGESTEDYIRKLMDIPGNFGVLAVLALGIPAQEPEPHPLPCTDCEKVHYGKF